MSRRQQKETRQSVLVGLSATAVVIAVFMLGGLDWIELKTLDLRYLYANATSEDTRIVCIDIDDAALEVVQRWPWPRDVQAAMIDVLREAGLKALLYDIELSEPEPVRTITPRHADIVLGAFDADVADDLAIAFPDHELRLSLGAMGRSYLAFHYDDVPAEETEVASLRREAVEWLAEDGERATLAPGVLLERFLAAIGADRGSSFESALVALRGAISLRATLAESIAPHAAVAPATHAVQRISPVYFPHARAARRCGFVVFAPDQTDGVMRRTRLLASYRGHVIPQLAFAVAFDELGLSAAEMRAEPGRLTFTLPSGERRVVQVDEDGRALVPWVAQRDWTRQFGGHVPIGAAYIIVDRREKIRQNRDEIVSLLARLIERGQPGVAKQYRDDLARRLELDSEWRAARYRGDDDAAARIRDWMKQYDELLDEERPKLRAAIAAMPDEIRPLQDLERAFASNDRYRVEIRGQLDRLRGRLQGKIGLVGYTATALADMTPIPTHTRAPGVVAHANLLNGLLTGQLVRWAPVWFNALLAALLGLATTVMSARYGPRIVGLVAIVGVGYVVLAGWLAFYAWLYWIAVMPAMVALVASYVAVVVYRYLFLERESREIARALGQYTSATLAKKMAEDAELCKRAETREVTAVFTDLAGFTTISEEIGAERTQHVLNVSLGCLSDVILRYEGMINKFIGDGIFAFWNPVIYPQDDHARLACETAIDLQVALAALIDQQREMEGDRAFDALRLRIGVATGSAVVGPCGSEQKYDYTCIGDSVNVAARLESANKFYGTRILISGATHDRAGDSFVTRPLGSVQVKGKTRGVPIFELLGRRGVVPDGAIRYAAGFAAAVGAFQRRDFAEAGRLFAECRGVRPDDLAAMRYVEAIEGLQADPPPDDWTGALELKEK